MATITASITLAIAGTETVEATESPASGSGGNTRKFNAYNQNSIQLDGSSTPRIDKTPADLSHTLAGASKVFDLTAVPSAKDIDVNVDMTGAKLIAILIKADAGNNAAGITVEGEQAGGNPYDLFGPTGSGKITIFPGVCLPMAFLDAAAQTPIVGAGVKDIEFAGAAGDAWDCIAYFGT